MKTQKLRLGIIGVSGRGHRLAELAHKPEDGVEIVAGMDPFDDKLREFSDCYNHQVGCYKDYRQMIEKENLDGVLITSPDYCHEEQASFALSLGIPVYLEKPMAITTAGCDRILKTARDNHVKLMLGHNMRYMNFTNKMKSIIDSGAIGEIKAIWCRHFISYGGDAYFRDWHADRRKSNSLLLQKGAHDIDIIHWLAGSYSSKVSGMGSLSVYNQLPRRDNEDKPDVSFNSAHWPPTEQSGFYPVIDVADHNMIMMQLANGVQACYMQCHYTPDSWRNYTVIGTKGRIENYGDIYEDTVVELWNKRVDRFRLHGDATFQAASSVGSHGGADPKIVQGFIDYLRGEHTPVTTPQASRYAVAAGCAGADSIRNGGGVVEVPPLDPDLETYKY
ncbi:MAG: Gfo/Idh/MocA family oxidoreductase [Kiritimatiellales bacterium]